MNATAQKWLAEQASSFGTLACGLRKPDGKFVCQGIEEFCSVPKMEELLSFFATLHREHVSAKMTPRWSTWSFERGYIRFVARPDGWILGLLVQPGSDAANKLDELCMEFLSAPLEG